MSLTQHLSELQARTEPRVASDTAGEGIGKGYHLYSPRALTVALMAAQVLLGAMKGRRVRRVLCLVTLCVGVCWPFDGCLGGFGTRGE